MLRAYPTAYRVLEAGRTGPSDKGDPKPVVLGVEGDPSIYGEKFDDDFRWYRYLFFGRGKPSTHVRVLSVLDLDSLKSGIPEVLSSLLTSVAAVIDADPGSEAGD